MKILLKPATSDDLIRLLRAWRFWLAGAVAGGLIGAAVYLVTPPVYRARATVNVDFHLEQAWPQETDRQQFYYLERETRKLEEIAYSDAAFSSVAAQFPGMTVTELRTGRLRLDQPGNGGWHFYADDRNPAAAAALASAWAQAFAVQVRAQVLSGTTSGLEPYITADLVQTQDLPIQPVRSMSLYSLAGALVILAMSAIAILFVDLRS